MNAAQILSYYPTYANLDEVLSIGNYKKINLFIDLKNVLQSLYLEYMVKNIVENSLRSNFIDTNIFTSIIMFLSFHKTYAIKRAIDLNFYIFFETGQSFYHINIDKRYKANRRIDNLFGLDREKRDLFFTIIQKNLMLANKSLNLIPNIKVIHMENFEADFIPYYLISNNLIDCKEKDICNIIYSNDHDMYQTLSLSDNIYQFFKSIKKKYFINNKNMYKYFLNKEMPKDKNENPLFNEKFFKTACLKD